MGFEEYDGSVGFEYEPVDVVPEPPVPEGYAVSALRRFDWRPRLSLDRRISPSGLQVYEPLVEARYRQPWAIRAVAPLILRVQGIRDEMVAVRVKGSQEIVAWSSCDAVGSGPTSIGARLDPAYAHLASFFLQYALHRATTLAPEHRITFSARSWMTALLLAADELGLQRKTESLSLGLKL